MSDQKSTAKKLGLLGCVSTGVGAIVGSGIFGSLPTVINDIGPGVILALIGAVIYTLARAVPNMYVSSVVPASGSFFLMPTKLIHPAVGMYMAVQNLFQPVLISVFAVLFSDYLVALFPGLDGHQTLLGVGILVIFAIIAYMGNYVFASFNSIMVGVLMVAIAVYVCVGLPNMNPGQLVLADMFSSGTKLTTLGAGIAVLSSSLSGGTSISQIADDVKNPRRNIPLAILLAPVVVAVIYILMAVVTLGAMPEGQLTTLSEVAKGFLSPALVTFFIVGGPLCGVLTSMVPVIMMTCSQIQAAAETGLFPAVAAKKNKHGISPVALVFVMLFAIVITSTGATFGVLMTLFSFANCLGDIVLCIIPFFLRKKYPHACRHAGFTMPLWVLYAMSVFAIVVAAYLSYSALLTLGATVWLLLAIFAVVFVAYVLLRIAYLKKQGRDLMAELKAPYAPFEEREAECAAMDAGK